MSKKPLIRVRNLKKSFPRERVDAPLLAKAIGKAWGWTGQLDEWDRLNEGLPILKGIDLDIYQDETVAILGRTGAGKSTLLHLIGALDKPTEGSVLYEDRDLAALSAAELDHWRNQTVGYVFQFYHLFPDLDAEENVLLPAMVANSTLAYMSRRAELKRRAAELLEQVGLADRMHHRPSQLSGGEQQRVAIARALILEPKLLLCDEPTGNLDRKTGSSIMDLLWKLKKEQGQTYVIVTHDESMTQQWADRVVRVGDGVIESIETIDRTGLSRPGEEPRPESVGEVGRDLEGAQTEDASPEAATAEEPGAAEPEPPADDRAPGA